MKRELNFDLKQIKSYLTVLEEKSFTKASRRLKLGQATISNHILLLEEGLGVSLIRRSSKDFSVTRDGLVFKEFCERMLADLEETRASFAREDFPGIVRIASSTIPSAYILPRLLGGLRSVSPETLFRVEISDSREVIEKVKEGVVDAGISGKMWKHPSLVYHKIQTDEIVLVTSDREYPEMIGIEVLKELPLISREKGSGTRDHYETVLSQKGILPSELKTVLECSTSESVKEGVLAGMGMAFLSRLAIERELALKLIRIVKVKGLAMKRDFYLVHMKNRSLTVPVKLLLSSITGSSR